MMNDVASDISYVISLSRMRMKLCCTFFQAVQHLDIKKALYHPQRNLH